MSEQEIHRGEANYSIVRVPVRDATGRFAGWGYEHRYDATAPQFITATDNRKRHPWTGAIVFDAPERPAGPLSAPYVRPGGEPQPPPTTDQRDGRLVRDRVFARESSVDDLVDLAITGDAAMSGLAFDLLERDDDASGTADLAMPGTAMLDDWARRHVDLTLPAKPGNAIDLAHSDDGLSDAELGAVLATVVRGMAIVDVTAYPEESS